MVPRKELLRVKAELQQARDRTAAAEADARAAREESEQLREHVRTEPAWATRRMWEAEHRARRAEARCAELVGFATQLAATARAAVAAAKRTWDEAQAVVARERQVRANDEARERFFRAMESMTALMREGAPVMAAGGPALALPAPEAQAAGEEAADAGPTRW
jgi:hypothetical protein